MKKMNKQREEFPLQSTIGYSYDFVVDVKNPFYIKFPFVIENPGQYKDNSIKIPTSLRIQQVLEWVV